MKVIMIYDQIQAGAGTKDDKMIGLKATKETVGPAVMMDRYLKANDEHVIATLYCGNGYFMEHQQEVVHKLCAMVKKLNADGVMCGPAFNYAGFALMCAMVADQLKKENIPVVAAMSAENETTIEQYRNSIPIVRCPKKGGTGLNETLSNMCRALHDIAQGQPIADQSEICF
ncbi:GrdB-related putative oxidoreductase [uncultured Dubosiella sp.]|uniref:GrdB-related putative oxidoreductase n=1 Tax=uncultured Dubosiella sp. TaxID=1937011 RepID=UPI0026338448|nr:GrdB-related putative oxidoreductase [uncultured Dubosiella sp.]